MMSSGTRGGELEASLMTTESGSESQGGVGAVGRGGGPKAEN